ncbi:MAG: bifunctional DNA-formamidopyrimidine glycosylase/DNA-(apurinic or apyrimidinic site) lyase [Desulfobulbaceae bacterium]|nr:bifunctional DNA-formamidopyrimidine glycosylase/DNA-(apurinic or apyrimidinic site) lyase [Desulfobulbaceae bacterium]
MPELPEVEVTRLGLLPHLPGRKIKEIRWSDKPLRTAMPEKLLKQHIRGIAIETIDRRGKYLLFRMVNNSTMLIHLGMTGKLTLLPAGGPPAKHDHLCLLLDDGQELRFNDSRRFGSIAVWPPAETDRFEAVFSAGIGVEPLSDAFESSYLHRLGSGKKQPVKCFLMDAAKIAGIGNIYANEILFAAGIYPLTPVNRITRPQWKKIVLSTGRILRQAIACGGSSISDFLGTSGNPGYFQIRFKVYGREGENCLHCGTPIRKTVIAGRATFFCSRCQKKK